MNITKEFYENAIKELENTKQLSNSFLQCMYQHYLNVNKEKYGNSNRLEDFNEFIYYFQLFLNMPVTFGNTPQEMLINRRNVDINLAIKKTVDYFNKFFNITMVQK